MPKLQITKYSTENQSELQRLVNKNIHKFQPLPHESVIVNEKIQLKSLFIPKLMDREQRN